MSMELVLVFFISGGWQCVVLKYIFLVMFCGLCLFYRYIFFNFKIELCLIYYFENENSLNILKSNKNFLKFYCVEVIWVNVLICIFYIYVNV